MFASKQRRSADIGNALRELLLARANGVISAEEFEQREAALHAAALAPAASTDAWRKLLLPIGIVAAAVALYAWLGNPNAIKTGPAVNRPDINTTDMSQPQAHAGGDLNDMVKRLADKLQTEPKNGEGWALLGHSYVELRRHAEAADAFARAAALLPADAGLLADWADAYVMSHDRRWDKTSRDIVKRALRADANHLKTLALAGSEAFDRKDYREAIGYWQRLKTAAPADSMDAKLADANIREATALLTGTMPAGSEPSASPAATASITGTVSVSARLMGKVSPNDTVFVVAKQPDGSGPPLAVKRYRVADLPQNFTLDETTAMVPGMSLGGQRQAFLVARISKTGNAIPAPGDIQTEPQLVDVGARDVALELGK